MAEPPHSLRYYATGGTPSVWSVWIIKRDGDGAWYGRTSYPSREQALMDCPDEGFHVERVRMRRTSFNSDEIVADEPRVCCVYPGCDNSRRTRGVCHQHYQTMRSYLRQGTADESDLMRRGLLLPKGQGGAKCNGHEAFKLGSEVRGDA